MYVELLYEDCHCITSYCHDCTTSNTRTCQDWLALWHRPHLLIEILFKSGEELRRGKAIHEIEIYLHGWHQFYVELSQLFDRLLSCTSLAGDKALQKLQDNALSSKQSWKRMMTRLPGQQSNPCPASAAAKVSSPIHADYHPKQSSVVKALQLEPYTLEKSAVTTQSNLSAILCQSSDAGRPEPWRPHPVCIKSLFCSDP